MSDLVPSPQSEAPLVERLTHLERETETQRVRKLLQSVSLSDLRRARAWMMDIIEAGTSVYLERAQLRGELIHREIEAREANLKSFWKRLGGNPVGPAKTYQNSWASLLSAPSGKWLDGSNNQPAV